jgi:hypothetical protein
MPEKSELLGAFGGDDSDSESLVVSRVEVFG